MAAQSQFAPRRPATRPQAKRPNAFWSVKGQVLRADAPWSPTQRLVALAVADRMREVLSGCFECWCSSRDIAARTGFGMRAVRYALDVLCKKGNPGRPPLFTRRRRKTSRGLGSYIFRLVISPESYGVACSAAKDEAPAAALNLSPAKCRAASLATPDRQEVPRRTSYLEPRSEAMKERKERKEERQRDWPRPAEEGTGWDVDEERAAILEHEAGFSRNEAERRACVPGLR